MPLFFLNGDLLLHPIIPVFFHDIISKKTVREEYLNHFKFALQGYFEGSKILLNDDFNYLFAGVQEAYDALWALVILGQAELIELLR